MLALLDHIPMWALGIGAGGLALVAFYFLGLRGALAVGAAAVLGGIYKSGQKRGIEETQRKVDEGNAVVVKRAKEIEDASRGMSDKDLDKENAPWVRK